MIDINKSTFISQGYIQIEGIDFEEMLTPIAHLESVRLLIGLAYQFSFKLYQMDVKSAYLNGVIKDEVYVDQSKQFEDPHISNHIIQLKKVMYSQK